MARPTQYASKIDYQNFAFLINKVLRAQKGIGEIDKERKKERKKGEIGKERKKERRQKKFFLVSSTCGKTREKVTEKQF